MAYNKLSNYKTLIGDTIAEDGRLSIRYHTTDIVTLRDNVVTLNSGGWHSVTTKTKMNQASHQFNLGYGVFQRQHVWYVDLPDGETVDFEDGMRFYVGGGSV